MQTQSLFLSLLRAALWGEKLDASAFAEADWKQIFRLADTQTVPLLILDGMGMLPKESMSMPLGGKEMLSIRLRLQE